MKLTIRKSFQSLSLCLLLVAGPSVYAQAKDNTQQLSNDISVLQRAMSKIEKDMSKLNRLLDNRAMLELFQRMDDLADEVSSLRGMLEQQTHDLAGLKKRQRELYLDTDRRLRELEITSSRSPVINPAIAPAAPVITPPESAGSDSVTKKPETMAETPVAVLPQVKPVEATRPATISSSTAPPVTVSEEREAYQKAFDMLKEGRYKMANAAFLEFVARYPTSSYAGNSQYWLGESNYVSRQFKQATLEFRKVLSKYPDSNKVPDAMLKLGYTYYELREFESAKTILTQLKKTYSKSTAARLAGKRLDRMHKEGH